MRTYWIAALAGIVLLGCSSAVTLRHRDGRVVTCGPYTAVGFSILTAPQREAQCISDYQRQGFERAPE